MESEEREALMKPKYSVIVVTFNAIEHTIRCVQSVFRHTKDFELIIVDNASTDGTKGYLADLVEAHKGNVRVIFNEENKNFGPANNQGYRKATGDYIVLLNSDTIVTPGWLDRMTECMEKNEGTAIVGPLSNSSNGRQAIQRLENSYAELDRKSLEWSAQHYGLHEEAGVLYGWCMLVSREFMKDEPYLFDERFTNSFEDNDLCLRARLKGFRLFIDRSTYIHHVGQGSFVKSFGAEFIKKYSENGIKNQDLFYQKWKPKDVQKVIAVYRIANCEQYIRQSMEQTSKFADEIICLFARSKDKTKEIALSFPKVKAWEEWNEPEHPFDEAAERDWLLQKAIERGADWVISVDGDEVYEDKFIDIVPRLIKNPNPQVFGYWCNWRTVWDTVNGQEMFRSDGIFGGFQNYRFFKILPGMKIKPNDNIYNHHCGSAPFIPSENLKWLNVRVRHLGYDSPEQRKRKYEFYRKADPNPLAKDVGNADYHHLIDSKVDLKPYRGNNRLTIMSVIKNEQDHIYRMMECVEPIADEFVIVDNGSTDGTLAEIDRFRRNHIKPVRVVTNSDFAKDNNGMLMNYSEAKNFGKSLCTTEWVLQMDADELFESQLVGSIFGFMDEDADAYLFNVINYLAPAVSKNPADNKFSISETIRMYRNIDEFFYSGLVHESLEDSVTTRVMNGKARLIMSPIHIHHHGYLKNKDTVREKIDRYMEINKRQIEVSDQTDPRPYFNIALHYFNEGDEKKMIECYEKCLELQPSFWRAKQNLSFYHLHKAKMALKEVISAMPVLYRENNKINELSNYLNGYEFLPMKVG